MANDTRHYHAFCSPTGRSRKSPPATYHSSSSMDRILGPLDILSEEWQSPTKCPEGVVPFIQNIHQHLETRELATTSEENAKSEV